MKKAWFFSSLAAASFLLCAPLSAGAANIMYANPVDIVLSSPAVTLTIASGSVADQLMVNATSVLVSMSVSTGGTFTLTSPSSDLSLSASAGGGSDPVSCTAGVASVAISQSSGSATYTIAPTGTQCSSGGGGGGGGVGGGISVTVGGGGGGSSPVAPAATSTPATTTTDQTTLLAEIAALQTELQNLLALAAAQQTQGTYHFIRNLGLWSQGSDVAALQKVLIAANVGPAARALAAHGVTRTFGPLTFRALIEYQRSRGLSPTGFFGPLTRKQMNTP